MSEMQLLAIFVGKVQTWTHNGKPWETAYKKQLVDGAVQVNSTNVAGDEQKHKKVHGGPFRAILMYSAENYDRWQDDLDKPLMYGAFAENFTVRGMDEQSVCLGDVYQVGETVRVQVAQPRQPCNQIYKALGIRGIQQQTEHTRRTGWYLSVQQTGMVRAGMPITLLQRPHPQWTILRCHEVMEQYRDGHPDAAELASLEALEPSWRERLSAAVG